MNLNLKAISQNVGLSLLVNSVFMLLCMGAALLDGGTSNPYSGFRVFLICFLITFSIGVFPFIFIHERQQVSIKDGYVIIVLSWLLSFVFGMMPYVLWGGEFTLVNAWFESVSGYTTTGATILKDIEALPKSILLWRSSTHFVGGLGVVVFLMLILPSASPFRNRVAKLEMNSLAKEGYNYQSRKMISIVTVVYAGIFVLATLCLMLAGMPWFDAINHGLSLCATGGFSIKNASIASYDSTLINVVVMIFMVIATMNFALIFTCFLRRSLKPLWNNKVIRFYLTSILVLSAIVILSLQYRGEAGAMWKDSIVNGFCTVVSYITTTGFGFADNSKWPMLCNVALMYAAIQCACAGSTSSGIKVDRMLYFYKSLSRQITTNLHSDSVSRIKVEDEFKSDSEVLSIILYIILYFLIIGVSFIVLLIMKVPAVEAISGTISSIGNVGPGLGEIAAAGNYSAMPAGAKMIFTLDMFLGRTEIYPFLTVLAMIVNKRVR